MPKWKIERQTLNYRSPECLWEACPVDQSIDMWSVGVVIAYMCGNPFTEVTRSDLKLLVRKWRDQLGDPPDMGYPLQPKAQRSGTVNAPKEATAWPSSMAIVLGKSGKEMVNSLLSYNPVLRLSSGGVLEHSFLSVGDFPLMGLCRVEAASGVGFEVEGQGRCDVEGQGRCAVEGHGRLSFHALLHGVVGQSLLAGERHSWRLRVREVAREVVLYILKDDAFVEGTAANALVVKLASGGEVLRPKQVPRCQTKGPKTRIAGRLGVMAGVSMIGLDTREPFPVARVLDFMKAFRKVNEDWLLVMQISVRRE